ncbi:MAG: COX15/CtaA family protein [Bacteroidota bacterium]|nr:COX15/CtaA family protein [Bacteroidota bacterium]
MSPNSDKPIIVWLFTGCALIFLMVVIGGITRLTQSGLSIVEWNLLMGTIPPFTEQAWHDLFLKYQQSPQYQLVNTHFSLEEFKSIFWWEYIHRLFGRFIGLVFFIPFVYFLIKKKINSSLLKKLLLIFALGGFQGVLGWYMVKSGLVKDPAVSHYRLASHLITAFITFGFVFWVALGLIQREKAQESNFSPVLFGSSILLFFVLSFQIVYGAFVAGLKAGYSYTTFPKMGEEWIAESIGFAYGKMGFISIFENPATVQFIHRYTAYVIVLLVGLIFYLSKKSRMNLRIQKAVNLLVITVVIQFLLGVFTLVYSVPVVLGVLHQAGAFFAFAAIIYLLFYVSESKPANVKGVIINEKENAVVY